MVHELVQGFGVCVPQLHPFTAPHLCAGRGGGVYTGISQYISGCLMIGNADNYLNLLRYLEQSTSVWTCMATLQHEQQAELDLLQAVLRMTELK